MRRTQLLTSLASGTALGALLLAAPVLAQPAPGQGEEAMRQMRHEQHAASPGLPTWRSAATQADRVTTGPSDPSAWITQAQEATRRNRTDEAAELLERLGAARTALQSRDRAGALREMDLALAALRAMPDDGVATGASTGMMPMQSGGGTGMMPMQDGGDTGIR
jgi:hypothetical protein